MTSTTPQQLGGGGLHDIYLPRNNRWNKIKATLGPVRQIWPDGSCWIWSVLAAQNLLQGTLAPTVEYMPHGQDAFRILIQHEQKLKPRTVADHRHTLQTAYQTALATNLTHLANIYLLAIDKLSCFPDCIRALHHTIVKGGDLFYEILFKIYS